MMTPSLTASYNHLTAPGPVAGFVLCAINRVGPEGGADRRFILKRAMKAMRGRTTAMNTTTVGTITRPARLSFTPTVYERNHPLRTSNTPGRVASPLPEEEPMASVGVIGGRMEGSAVRELLPVMLLARVSVEVIVVATPLASDDNGAAFPLGEGARCRGERDRNLTGNVVGPAPLACFVKACCGS